MSYNLVSPRKSGPKGKLNFSETPIKVNSLQELIEVEKSYKRQQKVKFICECCGTESVKQIRTMKNLKCLHCKNSIASKENQKQTRKTKLEKYGNENYTNPKKRYETMMKSKLWSAPNCLKYENEYFDSFWELCFYLYHKCLGNNVIRNYDFFFTYKDNKNKTHRYYPDFKIDNTWIEIKGDNHFDENGSPNGLYGNWAQKYKCLVDNNVLLLKGAEMKPIFQYLANKYTDGSIAKLRLWGKQFRRLSPEPNY